MKFKNYRDVVIICEEISRHEAILSDLKLAGNSVSINNEFGNAQFKISLSGGTAHQTEDMLLAARHFQSEICSIYEDAIKKLNEKLEAL